MESKMILNDKVTKEVASKGDEMPLKHLDISEEIIKYAKEQLTHEDMSNAEEMLKVMQDILNIVKHYFVRAFDEDSRVYFRFLTHLKFLAQRLINNETFKETDDSLFEIVKEKYPDAYECTEKVRTYINKYYKYDITKEEMVYLIMHINRVVSSKREK